MPRVVQPRAFDADHGAAGTAGLFWIGMGGLLAVPVWNLQNCFTLTPQRRQQELFNVE
jgi:hypothetical protein